MSLKKISRVAAAAAMLSLASVPAMAQSQEAVIGQVSAGTGASTSTVASAINGVLASAAAAGISSAVVIGAVIVSAALVVFTIVGKDSTGNTVTTTVSTSVI